MNVDFVNSATAAGRDPLGNEWADTDTAAVDVVDPALRVEKTPDLQNVLGAWRDGELHHPHHE